jgi:23S rRNA-/tRNA-specific pseudouridylate synthase
MERKMVESEMALLDFLMDFGGFSTRTRARTAIKAGLVAVDGATLKIPSALIAAGTTITWTSLSKATKPKDFDLGASSGSSKKDLKAIPAPYDIVFEDDMLLAYVKPAGMVFASPKPQVKTSYTRMREWMSKSRPECKDVHFVNRIEKESSGICLIAKDLQLRQHLQDNWNDAESGMYVLVDGHLPPDDVITAFEPSDSPKKRGPLREFPYRTMRATSIHTLLKFRISFNDIPVLMSGLRRHSCMIVGKGKEAPDPMGRSGLHLFALEITRLDGEPQQLKSRVPNDFLQLMKGGKGPKAIPGKTGKKKRGLQNEERA